MKEHSLSDLIEICGKQFWSLEQRWGQIGATNHANPWWSAKSVDMSDSQVGATGATPEDAVLNLIFHLAKNLKND